MSTSFARDYHMQGEIAATKDGKLLGVRVQGPRGPRRVQRHRADVEDARGAVPRVQRLLRHARGALLGHRRLHEQVPGRRRVRLLVPDHRGRVPHRAARRRPRLRPGLGPGRAADEEPAAARAVPLPQPAGLGVRLRRLPGDDAGRAGDGRLRGAAPRAGGSAAPRTSGASGSSSWASACRSSPRRSAPGRARRWTSSGWAWPTAPTCRCTPPARPCCGCRAMSQGQGHETTFAQIVAEELGISPDDIRVVQGDTDQTPFGLGTYGSRSTPVSGGATALVARKVRERARIVAAAMLEVSPDDLEWEKGRFHVTGDPSAGEVHRRDRDGRALGPGAARGRRGAPGRELRLQPAEPDLPERGLHLRGRRRSGHRAGRRCAGSSPSTTAACGSTR